MFQLMPLPLTVSCFSKIQIGFAFLVPAHLVSPGKRAVKRVCVLCCLDIADTKLFDDVALYLFRLLGLDRVVKNADWVGLGAEN